MLQIVGELKLVLELVEGFLEELKLVLVIVKFFCLLDQQLWTYNVLYCDYSISSETGTNFMRTKIYSSGTK